MKQLRWRSILQRVERRRIVGLWYGVEDGYLHLELDDGSVILVAASWEEGCHVVVDPAVPATRKGRPTKEPPPNMHAHLAIPNNCGRGAFPLLASYLVNTNAAPSSMMVSVFPLMDPVKDPDPSPGSLN